MNYYAIKIGMKNTFYDSPHGLANKYNVSSAKDQALLTMEAFRIKDFAKIVRTE